jgi:plasmid stabilization system protein ParE
VRLEEIAHWTISKFGLSQAEQYERGLIDRLYALSRGELPPGRSCEALLAGRSGAKGLFYFREGGHFIIYRETDDLIVVIDFIHGARDLEAILIDLTDSSS